MSVQRYDPKERPPREPAPSRRECIWSCGCFSPEATVVIFLCPQHYTPLGDIPKTGGGFLGDPSWLGG